MDDIDDEKLWNRTSQNYEEDSINECKMHEMCFKQSDPLKLIGNNYVK